MLARARPAPRRKASIQRLGDGTMVFGGQITLEHSELLGDEPAVALRLYRQVRRRKLAPYAYARDHIARVAQDPRWACRVREDPEAVQLFCDLLSAAGEPHPGRRTLMADLHDVGLLLAMVPEFAPIVGRVEHDLYHVYTADVHAVAAVEYLRRLVRGDHKSELPLACRLAAEAPRRLPIFLALLTHGLGKPYGTDVGVKSAAVARPIALRLGLSPADADHVAWLVERQLEFYHWAVRRDTVDPEALADVAQAVQSPERLRDLYLFTVALVASTNPTAMTSWKACMLEELYRGVSGAFDSARPSTVHGRVAAVKKRLAAAVADGDERARVSAFVAGMPDRYMLANPVDTIRAHASIEAARGRRLMHVGWAAGPGEDVSEVVVVSEDRPRLLADVAAALAAQRLSVMSAQIHTRRMGGGDREAFDVFHVCRPGGGLVDDGLIAKLVHDLEQLKCDHVSSAELLARVPRRPAWALRRVPEVETNVLVDNASSSRFTIVDVFTRDRLGLLHVIARALHEDGLSIALSKVSTEGLRAADVFYVVDGSGAKIEGDGRLAAIANRVRVAVEAYHRSVGEGGHG